MNMGKEKVCPFTQSYIECSACKMYLRGACLIVQALDGLKMLGYLEKLNQLNAISENAKRLTEFENKCLKALDKIEKDVSWILINQD